MGDLPTELWRWLMEHGVPRSNIDEQPTRALINIYKIEKDKVGKQEAKGGCTNKKTRSFAQFPRTLGILL